MISQLWSGRHMISVVGKQRKLQIAPASKSHKIVAKI